jgi:hypothetical protein
VWAVDESRAAQRYGMGKWASWHKKHKTKPPPDGGVRGQKRKLGREIERVLSQKGLSCGVVSPLLSPYRALPCQGLIQHVFFSFADRSDLAVQRLSMAGPRAGGRVAGAGIASDMNRPFLGTLVFLVVFPLQVVVP